MTSIRDKYNKVKKLITQGATEGERIAAKEAMLRMEQKYPKLVQNQTFRENIADKVFIDEYEYISQKFWDALKKSDTEGIWVSMDFASTNRSTFQMWIQNPDGTWRQVK
jgi:hypothetical protein